MLARWPAAWETIEPSKFIRPFGALDVAAGSARAADRALIVIPCLNEAPLIAGVVARILEDERLVDPLVVVADGGSTDGSREILQRIAQADARVRLILNSARLQSAGVNLAARSMGEGRTWLVRVDAHADYPANYASSLIEEARRTGATSVVVAMDTRGDCGFQKAVAAAQNSVLGAGGAAHRSEGRGGWVDHGHHALFSLEAFQASGGYDEQFSHNEDAELDLRLARDGGRIWLSEAVRVGYHPRSAPASLARQYFSYGKGRACTVLKHHQPLKIRQTLPLAVAPAVASAWAGLLYWPLAIPALVWVATALTWGLILALRRRDPVTVLSGPAALIMHLAWSVGFWTQLLGARADREQGARPAGPALAAS
jgi:succinoglycan biosynthesis protein ExoA